MSAHDPDPGHEEFHGGHDLELGLLARMRHGVDVLPWLRLGRTLRVAASPPLLLVTAIAYFTWWLGETQFLGGQWIQVIQRWRIGAGGERIQLGSALSMLGRPSILGIAWCLFVWAPAALLVLRQGALLTAGRTMAGMRWGISHAARRTPRAWIAAVVPFACVLAMGSMILCLGWLSRPFGYLWIQALLAIIASAIALPCGILGFGASVAIPLSWAALANEPDPDPLDSLSRGYESLFRRPLQLVLYTIVSGGIVVVVGLLAWGIAAASSLIAMIMLGWSGAPPGVSWMVTGILSHFPAVVMITQVWGLVGGGYLLLRYDTGGQEVEDLWVPSLPSKPPLPEIPPQ